MSENSKAYTIVCDTFLKIWLKPNFNISCFFADDHVQRATVLQHEEEVVDSGAVAGSSTSKKLTPGSTFIIWQIFIALYFFIGWMDPILYLPYNAKVFSHFPCLTRNY